MLELSFPVSAFIYYRSKRLNLMTGYPEMYKIDLFLEKLKQTEMQGKTDLPIVCHFYYELGLLMQGLGHTVDEESPLAIELVYQKLSLRKLPKTKLQNVPLKSLERPTWSEYKKAFQHIQNELLMGNCYQVNLTFPFDFETEEILDPRDLSDFFFSRKNLSPYAHMSFIGDEMILSNSPECLFQYRNNEIFTMPIKGTIKRSKNWKKDWKKMSSSLKEESELNMITDLLKNDLNKLDKPVARIIRKRVPLFVPGLIHQCSILSVKLTKPLSLFHTLHCLFPGGSVTGAPKKRVMQIIQNTERFLRGNYCGSTLLMIDDRKVASINIRTAVLSIGDRLWRYGAGGGITLLSEATSEFQEMEAKVASFLTLLKTPGHPGQEEE